MATEIQLLSQKINDQFHNGVYFADNADTDFAPNLIGSIGERVRVRQTVSVFTYFFASEGNKFTFTSAPGTGTCTIEIERGSWFEEGFTAGDDIWFQLMLGSGLFSTNAKITALSKDTAVINTDLGSHTVEVRTDAKVINTQPLTCLNYRFGLIGNKESINFRSKQTGEDQRYYTSSLVVNSGYQTLTSSGQSKSWVSGGIYAEAKGWVPAGGINFGAQIFDLYHSLVLLPYYLEGDYVNILARKPSALLAGDASIKYVNSYAFSSTLSNPNGIKSATIDYILGAVGWFNETFNGLNSEYAIQSIKYTDLMSGADLTALKVSGGTRVAVTISSASGSFSSDTKVGAYLSYLPDAENYTNTLTDFEHNFMYSNAFAELGGSSGQYGPISDLACSLSLDSQSLYVTFNVEYLAQDVQRLIEVSEPKYLLAVQVGNKSKQLKLSDKVMLLADINYYSNEVILLGLAKVDSFKVWGHGELTTSEGSTDYCGWVEDGICSELEFSLDLSKQSKVGSISQKLVAYSGSDYFELDSTSIPLASVVSPDGSQQLEIDRLKPYPLNASDPFRAIKLTTLARVGNMQPYRLLTGQKLTWQDWLKVNAPTVFYDKAKPNSGLNKKASNYSNLNGYEVALMFSMSMQGIDELGQAGATQYNFVSPPIRVLDYDVPDTWKATIETLDADTFVSLDGKVYTDKLTLFRITWEKVGEPITDITNFWGINRIEVSSQNGFAKHELSSVVDKTANSPLVSLSGWDRLALTLVAGKVVCACLIDPSKIDVSSILNLSGRISAGAPMLPFGFKATEDDSPKYTESGEYKIVE